MLTSGEGRTSWYKATKFREHLSFINPSVILQPKPQSAWSPVTPRLSDIQRMESFTTPPPVPPVPAVHASHVRPSEQEADDRRSVERARAEAAAALERGSREREAERERQDRERQQRLLREKEREYDESRRKLDGDDEKAYPFEDVDMERGESTREWARKPPSSFGSRSKAALARLSQAVFRFTSTPAAEPSYPYPRDSMGSLTAPRQSRFGPLIFKRLPSPWPPLDVQDRSREQQPGSDRVYYGESEKSQYRSRSRSDDDDERLLRDGGRETYGEHAAEGTVRMKQHQNNRTWWIVLFILLLIVIGNLIFLDVRVLTKDTTTKTADTSGSLGAKLATATPTPTTIVQYSLTSASGSVFSAPVTTVSFAEAAASSPTTTLTISSCISQFKATTNPASFPCDQCIPILTTIPNDFDSSTASSTIGQGSVLQFCALQAINKALPPSNSNALSSEGWLKDTNACNWQGVSCDAQGRVTALLLASPGVPSTLPPAMENLVALQNLTVTGDGNNPSGPMDVIMALRTLQSLNIQNSALSQSFTDQATFSPLSALSSLQLGNNPHISISGSTLGGIDSMRISTLILNSIQIPNNALSLLVTNGNAITSSLTVLDLSSTSQSGAVPTSLSQALPNLVQLHLENNAYSALPDVSTNAGVVLPAKLAVVSFKGNALMQGQVGSSECQALQTANAVTCDFTGTGITLQLGVTSCGICQFGS